MTLSTLKRPNGAGLFRSRATQVTGLFALLIPVILVAFSFSGSALSAQATVDLGAADSFGALSFTAMTNAGADTVVNGDIGSPTSIDAGITHPGFAAYGAGSSELANAQASLLTAYGSAEAATPNQPSITGVNLAGMTLVPGVYNSTSGILISGPIALTLDGGGDPNAVFIFQAASSGDLTVDPTSSVIYTNGAQPCNVFWKVNSAFLKNTDSTFIGTILALTQITLTENITVEGRVLARNADVTFIHDTINKPSCATPPPPTTPPPTTPPPTTPPPTTPPPTTPPPTTPPPTTPPPTTPPPTTPPPTTPAPTPTIPTPTATVPTPTATTPTPTATTPTPTTPTPTATTPRPATPAPSAPAAAPAPSAPAAAPAPSAAPAERPSAAAATEKKAAVASKKIAGAKRHAAAKAAASGKIAAAEAPAVSRGHARPARNQFAFTG